MVGVKERVQGMSRQTKALIIGAVVIAILGLSGVLQAGNDVSVSSESAVDIATERLDFEPDLVAVRMVREGIDLHPIWAVSFSTEGSGDERYDQILVVSVDAQSGEIIRVARE